MRIRVALLLLLLIHCVNVRAAGIVVDSSLNSGVKHLEVVGDYAYCVTSKGLLIYDVSDPAQPVYQSNLNTGYTAAHNANLGLKVRYPYCYFSLGNGGFFVSDISDPQNPIQVGRYITTDDARGIALYGDYAFVGVDKTGWDIIDVSDPANPTLAGNYLIAGHNSYIVIRDTIAFITNVDMVVLNIVDPLNPVEIGSYLPPWISKGLHLEGQFAYVACAYTGYYQVDISDITSPVSAFTYTDINNGIGIWDIDVVGQTAYACGDNNIWCFSTVASTQTPTQIDLAPGLTGYGIHVEGNIIYVCCNAAGLIMYELQWRGDLNATGTISSTDIIFLVNYVFKNGTSPTPVNLADVNCDGQATASDVIYLVNYVFKGGDQPVCPD